MHVSWTIHEMNLWEPSINFKLQMMRKIIEDVTLRDIESKF